MRRIFRLDNNWTFIIIGGVILVAVVLDQVAHSSRRSAGPGARALPGRGPAGAGCQ